MTDESIQQTRRENRQRTTSSPADSYEQILVRALFQDWAASMLDDLDLSDESRLLDLACGTGIVSRLARLRQPAAERIVGVDVNPDMLDVARRFDESIEWEQADASHLPFAKGTFNIVACQHGLQFLPDPSAALREMFRVLAPRGRLVLSTWGPLRDCPAYTALLTAVRMQGWAKTARHLKILFSMRGEEVVELVENAGFTGVRMKRVVRPARFESTESFIEFHTTTPPLAAEWRESTPRSHEQAIKIIRDGVQHWETPQGLRVPMSAAVVSAVRPND